MSSTLPSTMRAMQWTTINGGLEKNLKFNQSAPLPKSANALPKDSTLVKVAFSTLNPIDYKLPEIPVLSRLLFSKPAIPCRDFAGTVVDTALSHLKPGDRVFGAPDPPAFGCLGEYVVISGRESVVLVPDGVSLADAAAIGVCGLTAVQSLGPSVKKGDKVLINGGSGGTGTFGIQVAKALGCSVTTTCSGPNVELCKSLGADEVIDYRTTDIVSHLKRQGAQYDLIIDNVNTPELYWNAQHYLKSKGAYVPIAGEFTLPSIMAMMTMLFLPRWLGGGERPVQVRMVKNNAEHYARVAEWMKEGKVKTVVEQMFELEDAAEAFARLKTGRTRGKLLIRVAGE